jgi:hypothetical protein
VVVAVVVQLFLLLGVLEHIFTLPALIKMEIMIFQIQEKVAQIIWLFLDVRMSVPPEDIRRLIVEVCQVPLVMVPMVRGILPVVVIPSLLIKIILI